jgi:hypothetical protein
VAGRDKKLLDHDRPVFLAVQSDIAGTLAVLDGDENHIAPEHLEYPLVTPAGKAGKRAFRERE